MFKKILFICVIFSSIGYGEINNTPPKSISLPDKLAEIKRTAYLDESSTDFSLPFSFQYENSAFSLYNIYDQEEYAGYVIIDDQENIVTFYQGPSLPDMEHPESLSPVFNHESVPEIEATMSFTASTNTTIRNTPSLNQNLFSSHYDSFSSSNYLIDCPSYYTASYGPVENGCGPTTGAMLVSFFDRYTDMTNLVSGLLPLEHSDNKAAVDELIITLADYMNTDSVNGTYYWDAMDGLTAYFDDRGYSQFGAFYLDNYADYSTLIISHHNPAYLRIRCINDNGEDIGRHAVLGIGVATLRYFGNFMITHYDWYGERTGNYYVSEDYFVGAIYMGEK